MRVLFAHPVMTVMLQLLFVLAVFGFVFSGYPLDAFHFSDFHYYSKEMAPFWGLSVVDPQTQKMNLALFYHNEGLMALTNYLLNRLPLTIEDKLVFVNIFNISIQLFNIILFAYFLRRLVGPYKLFFPLAVFLLYPFAAGGHFWQPLLVSNLAATFFLLSMIVFLKIDYSPGKLPQNLALRIVPSFVCLWLSIITVEFAVTMSPLYPFLAWYYGNGGSLKAQGRCEAPLYVGIAGLFLIASILPVFLFTGHNLTVFSYATRYQELASQVHVPAFLIAAGLIVTNTVLVYSSVLYANSLGIILYPLADLLRHPLFFSSLGLGAFIVVGLIVLLGSVAVWLGSERLPKEQHAANYQFLFALGILWTVLAYFPFSLSYGYPRNVGPFADRINVLGSMGSALCVGTILCFLQERVRRLSWARPIWYGGTALLFALLLLNLQLQKTLYLDAEAREQTLIQAVLEERGKVSQGAKEPIFLLDREAKFVSPRTRLHQALAEPSFTGKLGRIVEVIVDRYFLDPPAPTRFHFEGIYWFWSEAIQFYADLQGSPRPLAYLLEHSFLLTEHADSYVLGYQSTDLWEDTSGTKGFRSYPKSRYELLVMKIGESSFQFGRPIEFAFLSYSGAKPVMDQNKAGTRISTTAAAF